jgi:branched-chain amino acid transport system ATP-binding protein
MLTIRGLEASYGASRVLFGVDLDVRRGEVVTLLGRNGMGKTTTIKSLLGIIRTSAGSMAFDGHDLRRLPSYRIAQLGLGLVPEGRQVFPNLTVTENLIATAANRHGNPEPWTAERVFAMFPELAARRSALGNLISGGEQQMLAIGRALMTNPRLLILDEATEGLAPLIRHRIWASLSRVRESGLSILIVDKNIADLVRLADRHYVIEKGRIVWHGSSSELKERPDIQHRHLGV